MYHYSLWETKLNATEKRKLLTPDRRTDGRTDSFRQFIDRTCFAIRSKMTSTFYCWFQPVYLLKYFNMPVFRRDVLWYGGVSPGLRSSVSQSFPLFSPTCFDLLSWNFVCHFLHMNIRSSSSVVNFRLFSLELCPFWNLEYWKYTVFPTFFWHFELKFCIWLCFTVLQITFKCRQFLWELCPFWNLEYWKYTCFVIL